MSYKDFNKFYKSYLKAINIKNIHCNLIKFNNLSFMVLHGFLFFLLIDSMILVVSNKYHKLGLILLSIFIIIYGFVDKVATKNCVKILRKKYQTKFVVPTYFEQLKYYLWMEKLKDTQLHYSADNALQFLEMELSKFKDKNNIPTEYIIIVSSITLTAFWHIFDNIPLITSDRIAISMLIAYLSWKFIQIKLYIFSSKEKKLRELKQFLLRLGSELER